MSCRFICDGCGKEKGADTSGGGQSWCKPLSWFQRSDKDGIQDACSRECIDKIAKALGKTGCVLPV